jgi:hypothetical protein
VKVAVLVWDEPTAVHRLADEHETESKAALTLGRNSPDSVQRDPLQRSANPEITCEALNSPPTAMHSLEVGHDTLASELETALGGRGVFTIDHRVPFQRSTSGTVSFPATTLPTAVHARRDEHVTPFRILVGEPAGLGVGTIRQCVPSHRSASMLIDAGFAARRWAFRADSRLVCLASNTSIGPEMPTAMQNAPDVHDMPSSRLDGTARLGVGCTIQCDPVATGAADATADPAATTATAARLVSFRFMVGLRWPQADWWYNVRPI